MNGLGTGRSSHGSGQLWGRPWWSPQCPCAGEILSGRGQAPPLRSSAVPRFSHIQAGAAGALQRKPPPPENHRQNSPGEVPRRGNRNSPFLAVSRGGLLRRGKSESPALTRLSPRFPRQESGAAGGIPENRYKKGQRGRCVSPTKGGPMWAGGELPRRGKRSHLGASAPTKGRRW